MVNILNVKTGKLQLIPSSKTVDEAINEIVQDSTKSNYALVFYGKKLKPDMALSDVEHLDETRTVKLIEQNQPPFKHTMSQAELNKHIDHCKLLYRQLVENSDPIQLEKLTAFVRTDQYNKEILGEFSNEIKNFSQLAQDAILDMQLLITLVIDNKDFAIQNPHCVLILKNSIKAIFAQDREEFNATRNRLLQSSSTFQGFNGARDQHFQNALPLQNVAPAITQDMLQQALAFATGTNSGEASTSVINRVPGTDNIPPPPIEQGPSSSLLTSLDQYKLQYQPELEQMREFGFTNVDENVQALCVTDGNVELALQFIIDSRMEE